MGMKTMLRRRNTSDAKIAKMKILSCSDKLPLSRFRGSKKNVSREKKMRPSKRQRLQLPQRRNWSVKKQPKRKKMT